MKTVVITGANRGIGFGFVKHYLTLNYKVVALSRQGVDVNTLGLRSENTKNLISLRVDLSNEESIATIGEEIKQYSTQVDLLINNAGVANHETFGQLTHQGLLSNYQINAVAPALLTQALHPFLNVNAKVIFMSSGLASINDNINPLAEYDAYSMSKTALNMLARRVAAKFKAQEIVVTAVSPGWVKTAMGGEEAPVNVSQAVKCITHTISRLTMKDSGHFVDESGQQIAW